MYFSTCEQPSRGRRSPLGGRLSRISLPTASATGPGAGQPRRWRGESGCRVATASGRLPPTAYWLLPAAYVYGSLPFVYLLGRQRNIDLHQMGSGNVGSTNLWAAGGRTRGVLGWIADASKGLVPIAMARRLGCDERTAELAGVCGVVGQCWPVFLRFNGGRGISAFVGASCLIDRAAWVAALVPMVAGSLWHMGRRRSRADRLRVRRSKSVPLGCVVGTLTFPLVCWTRGQGTRVAGRRAAALAPSLLTLVILLRRLTAPLPDDATHGPAVQPQALMYRLLYDRNTSDE